jgi:hypothetical protein
MADLRKPTTRGVDTVLKEAVVTANGQTRWSVTPSTRPLLRLVAVMATLGWSPLSVPSLSVGQVLAGLVLHPFAKAKAALQFYRDSPAPPEEVTTYAGLLTSPEIAKTVATASARRAVGRGARLIAPVRRFGRR